MDTVGSIESARLRLVPLDQPVLRSLAAGVDASVDFRAPAWWPDGDDVHHLAYWLRRAEDLGPVAARWGPRALVGEGKEMIGHAGFHGPPVAIGAALADPTYRGPVAPTSIGAVEIGYTVFPAHRRKGYASEAVQSLVAWAGATGEVSAILATVAKGNDASIAVLDRVGGFAHIGDCIAGSVVEDVFRLEMTVRREADLRP